MNENQNRRAEIFLRLADRASARFESRRAMEWKTHLALWSAFGVGTGFVLATDPKIWRPTELQFWFVCLLTGALFVVYYAFWLPYLDEGFAREARTGYWWQTKAEKEIEADSSSKSEGQKSVRIPAGLRPESKRGFTLGNWASAHDPDTWDIDVPFSRWCFWKWHEVRWIQLAVTVFLIAVFLGSIWVKAHQPGEPGWGLEFRVHGK